MSVIDPDPLLPVALERRRRELVLAILVVSLVLSVLGTAGLLIERTRSVRCRTFTDRYGGDNFECRVLRCR